jgi:hypothetical protein
MISSLLRTLETVSLPLGSLSVGGMTGSFQNLERLIINR